MCIRARGSREIPVEVLGRDRRRKAFRRAKGHLRNPVIAEEFDVSVFLRVDVDCAEGTAG